MSGMRADPMRLIASHRPGVFNRLARDAGRSPTSCGRRNGAPAQPADRHRADVRRGDCVRLPRRNCQVSQRPHGHAAGGMGALHRRVSVGLPVLQPGDAAGTAADPPADVAGGALGPAARLDVFNFLAFRYLQLDQALSILFSTPFLVAALAGPMLGEWIGWRRWIAILVGFSGVLLVTRPGRGRYAMGRHSIRWVRGVLSPSIGIATRILSRTDSNETTLFYTNVVGVVAMLPVLPVRLVDADEPGYYLLMLVIRRLRQLRPLSADRRPPADACFDPVAVHVYPTHLGDLPRLFWCSATCRTTGPWPEPRSSSPRASTFCIVKG